MGFSLKQLVKHAGADINPFDGPRPASTAHPSLGQQIGNAVHQVAQNPIVHMATTTLASTPVVQPYRSIPGIVNTTKAVAGTITGNNQAAANAAHQELQRSKQDLQANLDTGRQFVTRPAVQVATTLAPKLAKNGQVAPTNPFTRAIIGNTPVQNIQQGVRSTYQEHANLPAFARIGLAGLYGAGQIAQDIPVLGGAKTVGKVVTPTLKDIATAKPFRNVSDKELAAVQRVAQSRGGFGDSVANVKPNDVAVYRQVQKKLGTTNVEDHSAIEKLIGARQTYETRQAQQAAKIAPVKNYLQEHPIGLSMKDVSKDDPLTALKQEALKYKSADEFVNSHKSVYHGTNAPLKDITELQSGRQRGDYTPGSRSIFASENPELAKAYGKTVLEGKNTGKVLDTTKLGDSHDPNKLVVPKEFADYKTNPILEPRDRRVLEESYFKGGTPSNITIDHLPNVQEYFRSKGYSAIQIPRGSDVSGPATEMSIIDHNAIKTKQQLTDLYNQAHAEAKPTHTTKLVQPTSFTNLEKSNEKVIGNADKAIADSNKIIAEVDNKPLKTVSATATKPRSVSKQVVTRSRSKPQGTSSAKPGGGSLPKDSTAFEKNLQDAGLAPKVTTNSLTRKVARQNLSPEAQKLVQGEGFVRNTKQLADEAATKADSQSLNKTIQQAHESLAVEPGKIDDATVASVQQAIERADAVGRTNDAVTLHDALSEHLRKQGQTIQAASLLYKLSPQGLLYKGLRDIKQSGTKVTPELEAKLRAQSKAIKTAPEGEAKDLARAKFHKTVADNIKKKAINNALSVWKAGLLSGPLTHAGNFASNETFNALKNVSNPISAGVDRLISLGSGKRTKVATLRGTASGTKQGFKEAKRTLTTGIDVRNIEGSKYEVHGELNFKNPVVQKVFGAPSNGVFRLMSAGDQPVYYRNLKQNLYDLGLADGKNQGLSGQKLITHAQKLVANPTRQIAETAKLAAQKSVLAQDSKIAASISRIAQEHPALQAVVPFVKVPTNFLSRTLDFSPAGLGKAGYRIYKDAKAGRPFDQRALSEAIGEGLTGTGIIAIGTMLANNRLLSGQYPSNDSKEQQRWKAEGIQPNSVKLGNKWVNLNYLGPVGLLLGAGKDYHTAASQGDNGAMQAIAGLGKGLAGQSFLTGFSGAANAINDPGRYGANFAHSQAASVVPAWLNAVGNATDSKQRQADSTLDSVKARLPGVRRNLPVKNDVYGNPLNQRTNPFDLSFDPLKPSKDLSNKNPVVSEVDRLHNVDPNNSDLQVTPTPITTVKVNNQQIKLNDKQKYGLQKQVGQAIQDKWGQLIKTPEYQALSDVDKAKALSNLRTDIASVAQRDYLVNNNLATYDKQMNAKQVALEDGTGDLTSYARDSNAPKSTRTGKTTGTKSTKTAKAKSTGTRKSSGTSKTAFASALRSYNTAASRNQSALLNLVKNAKVSSRSGSKNVSVARAALKKQSVKKSTKPKVKTA